MVLFLYVVIHSYGRVILVPFKKCLFQFPLHMNFFRGHFKNFKKRIFQCTFFYVLPTPIYNFFSFKFENKMLPSKWLRESFNEIKSRLKICLRKITLCVRSGKLIVILSRFILLAHQNMHFIGQPSNKYICLRVQWE